MRYVELFIFFGGLGFITAAYFIPIPQPAIAFSSTREAEGLINTAIKQKNIDTTLCNSIYVKSIRPPTSYTNPIKYRLIDLYGYKDQDPRHYQLDHLIPISLAGDARSITNLWPQPLQEAYQKDILERYLNAHMCLGDITLDEAQKQIMDWKVNYAKHRNQFNKFGTMTPDEYDN